MTCCTMFSSWATSSLARALASADPDLAGNKAAGSDGRGYDPSRIDKLEETLRRCEEHFNRHLRILMDRWGSLHAVDDDANDIAA